MTMLSSTVDSEAILSSRLLPDALPSIAPSPSDFSRLSDADLEMQRLIDSQVESHKIGSAIADEALRRSSSEISLDLPTDLLQDAVFNQQVR